MIERYIHNKITWLDAVNPTTEEIRLIIDECDISREFTNDLAAMTPKTEVFWKKNFVKITLDFPIVKRTDINHPHEVKFLVTKTHLITIRFEDMATIHRFSKEFEMLAMLNGKKKTSADTLFMTLLNYFYESLYEKLDYIESKLLDAEDQIFSENENEREMVFELSKISRRLISYRQTIDAHEVALSKLTRAMNEAFTKDSAVAVDAIIHQYQIITRRLQALSSTFNDLRRTNDSVLETKQSQIMKIFTILAFITFPLTLFTSAFGMNTENTPIVGNTLDFWIIIGIMACVSIGFFIFFRYKRWL